MLLINYKFLYKKIQHYVKIKYSKLYMYIKVLSKLRKQTDKFLITFFDL